ncbi:MAG: hypothetical protein E5Y60_14990, partial [Mesorhizobium sp.]
IQETGKRPTAALDRNLAYLGLVEVLYGYPLDGVVLTIGCDKTTPALLMAAATVNIPAIALSVGPMLNGWHKGKRTGSGTIVWESRQRLSAGEIGYDEFMDIVARHLGVPLDNDDWQTVGLKVPLLVNLQPSGEYLGEDYHHAGGVPAVVAELMKAGLLPHPDAMTVNGNTIGANCSAAVNENLDVIRTVAEPLKANAGFINLRGNLFDSAIMKTSGISPEFRERYLSNPNDPEAFEGNAMVFDGPEDYHARIDDPAQGIDEHTILFMRGAGPIGYPGGAEVVNMQPPAHLIKKGIHALACIGDGRQSGTSGSPSILNASPEAAIGGGLALLKTGDRVRIDLRKGTADILVTDDEITRRRAELQNYGGYRYPRHQTPWQEIQRGMVDQFSEGMVLKPAVKYQDVAHTAGVPRDNH